MDAHLLREQRQRKRQHQPGAASFSSTWRTKNNPQHWTVWDLDEVAESSGAGDGAGHFGPRLNEKQCNGVTQKKGGKRPDIREGVVIVRTINPWYPATPSFLTTP
jgi:hypothetical protein